MVSNDAPICRFVVEPTLSERSLISPSFSRGQMHSVGVDCDRFIYDVNTFITVNAVTKPALYTKSTLRDNMSVSRGG